MIGYLFILFVFIILGYLFGKVARHKAYKLQKRVLSSTFLKHLHVHHSFIGLLIAVTGLLLPPQSGAFVSGFGAGLLLHHLMSEGFTLVSLDR